jgi:hypothetical protein
MDCDEILYGGDEFEDEFGVIYFNNFASTIPKWRTVKLLRWTQ